MNEVLVEKLIKTSKTVLVRLVYQNCVGRVTRTADTAQEREELYKAISAVTGETELQLHNYIGACAQDIQCQEQFGMSSSSSVH
jgi:hypothetical protein